MAPLVWITNCFRADLRERLAQLQYGQPHRKLIVGGPDRTRPESGSWHIIDWTSVVGIYEVTEERVAETGTYPTLEAARDAAWRS